MMLLDYFLKDLKLFRCLVLTGFSLLFTLNNVYAENVPDVVHSASEVDYPPFCIVHEDGSADGFSVELLRAALHAMGREVTFRTGPWADVQQWLKDGEVQVLPLVGRTPEREPYFDFTVPYLTMYGALVVRDETEDINSLSDLRGRRVGVMRADNAEEFLRREERGIDIVATPTFTDAFELLAAGECDAVIIQRLVALRLLQESGISGLHIIPRPVEEFSQAFCFAVKKDDSAVLALLNEGLALVIADGTYRRLYSKWFAAYELPGRRIIVGGDHAFPPFEFLDKRGRPAGFAVDMTRAIAEAMNLDVEIRLGAWDEVIESVKNGDIDVIQGLYFHPLRARDFDFSQPYHHAHYVVVGRSDGAGLPENIDGFSGSRVAVQRNDLMHYVIMAAQRDDIELILLDSQKASIMSVDANEADFAIVSRILTLDLLREKGLADLIVSRRPFYVAEYCYAVAKGNRALLAQFSEGLQMVEISGEYQRIRDKWITTPDPEPLLLVFLRHAIYVLIPLGVISLLVLVWIWSLRKQVAERTEALNQRLIYERLLARVSFLAISEHNLPVFFDKVLAAIGDATGVSRAYIFEHDSGNAIVNNKHEWCADGILPQKDNLQGLPEKEFEWWFKTLRMNRYICYADIAELPDLSARQILRAQSILSVLEVPLFIRDDFWGFIGFDQCDRRREWPDADIRLLFSIARIICGVIEGALAEEKLQESERRFRLLVENSPDAIFVQTGHRFVYLNSAAIKLFGAETEGDLLGTPVLDRFHHDFHGMISERIRLLNDERQAVPALDEICLRLDGTEVHAEVSAAPINYEGKDGALVFVRDISARREMEDRLRQSQKMESIGRLAGGIAHDYNNLLQVILGNAEMALKAAGDNEQLKDFISEINYAAERSVAITKQLLGFARKQTVAPEVLDLNSALEQMLKMLRSMIGENIELHWTPGPDGISIRIDPGQLNQIMVNLCLNARDAIGDHGKLIVQTGVTPVDAGAGRAFAVPPGRYALLSVRDTGAGMDQETIDNIFEPFFTTKGVGKGSGLGLSTVYGIVRQNSGFIAVDSQPGKGTVFRVYLPLTDKQCAAADGLPAAVETVDGSGETILLVEDEKAILKTVTIMLEQNGYSVLAAATPGEALEIARKSSGRIDLLITDMVMPEMNGRELSAIMQEIQPGIKRLFMSGYSDDVIAHQGIVQEGVNFIQKPFSKEAFFQMVRDVLAG